MGGADRGHLFKERLRPGQQRSVGGLRHLPRDHGLRRPYRRPMIVGQPQRHLNVEYVEQLYKVIGPAGRYRAGPHGVFQRQIPADDPGEEFAHRRIGIRIGAARQWDHRGKLGVTQGGEGASEPGEDEGQHQPGSGVVRAQSGQDEDAGPDHGAHSQGGQLDHAQGALQAVLARVLRFLDQ